MCVHMCEPNVANVDRGVPVRPDLLIRKECTGCGALRLRLRKRLTRTSDKPNTSRARVSVCGLCPVCAVEKILPFYDFPSYSEIHEP